MSERHLSAVIEVCNHINANGSTPTIGLIRAKLPKPVPLPEMVRGLKYWQSNPQHREPLPAQRPEETLESAALSKTDIQTLTHRIEALELALTNLQTEVQALKKQ